MPHQSDHRFLRRIFEFISFGTTLKIHCIEILAMRAAQLSRNKYMVTLKPLVNKIVIKELSWRPQFHHLHFLVFFSFYQSRCFARKWDFRFTYWTLQRNIDKNSFEYSSSMPLQVMTNGANAYDYVKKGPWIFQTACIQKQFDWTEWAILKKASLKSRWMLNIS